MRWYKETYARSLYLDIEGLYLEDTKEYKEWADSLVKQKIRQQKDNLLLEKREIWKELRKQQNFNIYPMEIYHYKASNWDKFIERRDKSYDWGWAISDFEKECPPVIPEEETKKYIFNNEKEFRDFINGLSYKDSAEFKNFILILAVNDIDENFKYNNVWEWLI